MVMRYAPETMGLSLEEIQEKLAGDGPRKATQPVDPT